MNLKQKTTFVTIGTIVMTFFFSITLFYLLKDKDILDILVNFSKDNISGFFNVFVPVNFMMALMISLFFLVIIPKEKSVLKEEKKTSVKKNAKSKK